MAKYYYHDIARWEGEGGALGRMSRSDRQAGYTPRQPFRHGAFWLKTVFVAGVGILAILLLRRKAA
jgi:hypothetical protein